MKKLIVAVVAVLNFNAAIADETALSELTKFLRTTVIGKTLTTKSVRKIAKDTVEADFERSTTFSNLMSTDGGIFFDEIVNIKQTDYNIDEKGKRTGPFFNKDRQLVARHAVREMKSTGVLVGRYTILSSTDPIAAFATMDEILNVKDDELTMTQTTALYSDCFAANNTYIACARDGEQRYYVNKDGLQRQENSRIYGYNAKTLTREEKPYATDKSTDSEKKAKE